MPEFYDFSVYLPLPNEKGLYPLGEIRLTNQKKLVCLTSKPEAEDALYDVCDSFNQKETFKLKLQDDLSSLLENWVKVVHADDANLQTHIPEILQESFGLIAKSK